MLVAAPLQRALTPTTARPRSPTTRRNAQARRAPQRAPGVHDVDEVVHEAADLVLEQVAAAADQREAQHQAQRRELGAPARVQALALGGARAVAAAARARLLAQLFPAREQAPVLSGALWPAAAAQRAAQRRHRRRKLRAHPRVQASRAPAPLVLLLHGRAFPFALLYPYALFNKRACTK